MSWRQPAAIAALILTHTTVQHKLALRVPVLQDCKLALALPLVALCHSLSPSGSAWAAHRAESVAHAEAQQATTAGKTPPSPLSPLHV